MDEMFDPSVLSPGSISDLMLGDWDGHHDDDGKHLCALCGLPIDDPLEECPTCAAAFDSDEDSYHRDGDP